MVDASSIWWSVHPCPWIRLSSLIDATASMLRCPSPFFFVRLCLFSRAEYIIRVVSGFLCLYFILYHALLSRSEDYLYFLQRVSSFISLLIIHCIKLNIIYFSSLFNSTRFFFFLRLMSMLKGRLWTTGHWSIQT